MYLGENKKKNRSVCNTLYFTFRKRGGIVLVGHLLTKHTRRCV